MDDFPLEVLAKIFKNLPPEQVLDSRKICRNAAKAVDIWKSQLPKIPVQLRLIRHSVVGQRFALKIRYKKKEVCLFINRGMLRVHKDSRFALQFAKSFCDSKFTYFTNFLRKFLPSVKITTLFLTNVKPKVLTTLLDAIKETRTVVEKFHMHVKREKHLVLLRAVADMNQSRNTPTKFHLGSQSGDKSGKTKIFLKVLEIFPTFDFNTPLVECAIVYAITTTSHLEGEIPDEFPVRFLIKDKAAALCGYDERIISIPRMMELAKKGGYATASMDNKFTENTRAVVQAKERKGFQQVIKIAFREMPSANQERTLV